MTLFTQAPDPESCSSEQLSNVTLSLTPVNPRVLESNGLVRICIVKNGISNENINVILFTVENQQAKSKNLKLKV